MLIKVTKGFGEQPHALELAHKCLVLVFVDLMTKTLKRICILLLDPVSDSTNHRDQSTRIVCVLFELLKALVLDDFVVGVKFSTDLEMPPVVLLYFLDRPFNHLPVLDFVSG